MSKKPYWMLGKIREAYEENLKAYEILFPVHFEAKNKQEKMPDTFNTDGDNYYQEVFLKKAKKILFKLKKIADKSGNAQIWHKGEPLSGLDQGMRERIERTLKFGI